MSNIQDFVILKKGTLKKYKGSGGDVIIPESVTSIGDNAFDGCEGLTSVTIPESVTSIGGWAFSDCRGLKCITIPESVTSIGYRAFFGCSGLTSVNIPESVTSINEGAFSGCKGLADENGFVIVNGVLYNYYGSGGDVTIPEGVTTIGDSAFWSCKGLTSVTVPEGVITIGDSAFARCSGLTNVTISEGVITIGDRAFWECSGLTNVTIPEGVKSIEYEAFQGCRNLISVTILNGVTSIGYQAFSYCDRLNYIKIPASVTQIKGYAFNLCKSLREVNIPNPDCEIGLYSFTESGVEKATVPVKNGVSDWFTNCGSLRVLTFTTEMSEDIGKYHYAATIALRDCPLLETVYAPLCKISMLNPIKHQAVIGFIELLSQDYKFDPKIRAEYESYIKKQKKKLYPLAVKRVSLLQYMMENKIIPANQVEECIVIAEKENNIEAKAALIEYKNREFKGTDLLKSELSLAEKAPTDTALLKKQFVTRKLEDGTLAISSYKGNDDTIIIPEMIGKSKVTQIGEYAFSPNRKRISAEAAEACKRIKKVVIGKNITEIGFSAFSHCDGLSSLMIDSSTKINDYAFDDCAGLADEDGFVIVNGILFQYFKTDNNSISIPAGISTIGCSAFSGHAELEEVFFHDGLQNIQRYAFANCKGLKSVSLPKTVSYVNYNAFLDCSALTTFSMEGSGSVCGNAFNGCKSLVSVTTPYLGLVWGSTPSFAKCSKLKEICITEGAKSFYLDAIKPAEKHLKVLKLPGSVKRIRRDYAEWPQNLIVYTVPDSAAAISALRAGLKVYDLNDPKIQITEISQEALEAEKAEAEADKAEMLRSVETLGKGRLKRMLAVMGNPLKTKSPAVLRRKLNTLLISEAESKSISCMEAFENNEQLSHVLDEDPDYDE